WLIKKLRQPVGAVVSASGWVGIIGELTHPLGPGQVSKVRVRLPGRPPRELLAVLAPRSGPLPRDCRVVVLDFRDGQAVVEAADPLMMPALVMAESAAVQAEPEPEREGG
ncbi:MAG TPA: hypothetical protein PK095_22020, partial [Myxococcota bacterium]|nr:hypothetical protein [Myxococcota bacterium]